MEAEVWKDIEGYEGKYQISNAGNVKSLSRSKEKILKPKTNCHKRLEVTLKNNNKQKSYQVASLVYKYFIDRNVDTRKNVIQYKDNNYTNCNIDNLYLIPKKEYHNQKEILDRLKKRSYRYKGQDYNFSEIATIANINKRTLRRRLQNGWSLEEAIEIPVARKTFILKRRLYKYNGQLLSVQQIAEKYNISKKTINKRLRDGWSIEETIEIPTAKPTKK